MHGDGRDPTGFDKLRLFDDIMFDPFRVRLFNADHFACRVVVYRERLIYRPNISPRVNNVGVLDIPCI